MVGEIHDHDAVQRAHGDAVGAPGREPLYTARDRALTRFANSRIHQNVTDHDASLRLRLIDNERTGVASTNRLDDEGLNRVLEQAAAIRIAGVPGAPRP